SRPPPWRRQHRDRRAPWRARARRLRRRGDALTGFLFAVGTTIVRRWPPRLRYGAAAVVGQAGFLLRPRLRRPTLEASAAILGEPPSSPRVRQVARAAMVGYTKLLADFLIMPALDPEQLGRMVEVAGLERVDEV